MWQSHLREAKYPPHWALSAPFLGLTVQLCEEPCGSAVGFDFLVVELVQIEKKSLLVSRFHAAGLRSHPRSTWQRPRSNRAGLCSRQHGGRWQAWEQLQLVRVPGLSYTIAMQGRDFNGREKKIFWMATKKRWLEWYKADASAPLNVHVVGLAGLDFHRLSLKSWALCFIGKLCVWQKSQS